VRRAWRILEPAGRGGVAARIAAARGLDPALEVHHDPLLMKGMDAAVSRIRRAIEYGESVWIFGDYDADGVTSSALLAEGLEELGARVTVRLPHRVEEGYGLQAGQVEEIIAAGAGLLVTADNGSSAHGPLEVARRAGLDVIVVDHHSPTEELPSAAAILNPRQQGCGYPFKSLAAVGVAWKLLQALGWRGLERGLDLAALGTVADLAGLKGENRLLVREGLKRIRAGARPGLEALLRLKGVTPATGADARTLGWQLGPRVNSAGRLAEADLAYELLRAADLRLAEPLALRLDGLNQERRRVQDAAVQEAEKALAAAGELPALLAFTGEDWHLGVIGLIAGRLSQDYQRPALVLTRSLGQGIVKGSARSVPGLHITEAIARHRRFLENFGGHAEAAGLTLREEHLEDFLEALGADVEERAGALPPPVLQVDCAVDPAELELSLARELEALEPCGAGNPRPLLGLLGARVQRIFSLSDGKHLKLWLEAGGRRHEAVWWQQGAAAAELRYGQALDLAFEPTVNTWNGRSELQLRVEDLRPALEES